MLKEIIISKAGFPFYTDYWDNYFCKMTGEQIKESMRIIFHFNKTFEILNTNDLAVEMVITTIIENIKRDAEKRSKQIIANRENGKNGGRPTDKKPKITKNNPLGTQDNPIEPIGLSVNAEDQFEEFWKSYNPIHTGKGVKKEAQDQFIKALKKDTIENINKGLEAYMADCHSKGTYTKQVDGWLKKMMWKAEYSQQPTQNNQSLCQAINKLIGSDLITKIEVVGSKAAFYTTKDGWQSITALDSNTKSEIKKTLNAALGVSEIEPKY